MRRWLIMRSIRSRISGRYFSLVTMGTVSCTLYLQNVNTQTKERIEIHRERERGLTVWTGSDKLQHPVSEPHSPPQSVPIDVITRTQTHTHTQRARERDTHTHTHTTTHYTHHTHT